jgi:hypothetical protein
MAAPRREYDPKRRPDIFYKGDEASNEELYNRSIERKDATFLQKGKLSLSERVSGSIGIDQGMNLGLGPTVSRDGKKLSGISIGDGSKKGGSISGGTSTNMPISGTQMGKWRKLIEEN